MFMAKCLVCNSSYDSFISFGRQPLANGFLLEKDFGKEYFFDMKVGFCSNCKMVQLVEQPNREQMFHENYAFYSSTSSYMVKHFEKFSETLLSRYVKSPDSFVVEMGSNDGIMLQNFAKKGIKHLGIEPSANVAQVARERGVNTVVEFFDSNLARKIVSQDGQADAFFASNVMCHIPYIGSIVEGVKILLKPSGVMAFEDPYLGDIIDKTSYDQIYDEHVFFFSLLSVSHVFEKYGMELIDIEPQITHGGSMRYFLANKGAYQVSNRVKEQINLEKEIGLEKMDVYQKFASNVKKSKDDLLEILRKIKSEGKTVIGYGATSKSTTIMNYCGITPDLIDYISDTTPIKQGKFSPGVHIPVKSYEHFVKKKPDYALLFAWNHKEEIRSKEKDYCNAKGKWITHVPNVHIYC